MQTRWRLRPTVSRSAPFRSAIFGDAGVTEKMAREFSGHKTDAALDCTSIADFQDLRDAAARLGKCLGEGEKVDDGRAKRRFLRRPSSLA